MNQKAILESVKKLREISKKRNFSQTFDLIINLQHINIKKQDEKVDLYIPLPHGVKKPKICALIGRELETKSKDLFSKVIFKEEFIKYGKDKKLTRKLASEFDYFVAQANLMGDIATAFGKVLGPKGKMPNPKAGCVVPPIIPDLKPIVTKLEKTAKLETKGESIVKASVGKEDMKDEDVVENILLVFNTLIHKLPQEKNNVKSVYLKLTMGQPVEVTDKGVKLKEVVKKEKKVEEKPKVEKKVEEKKETKEEPKEK